MSFTITKRNNWLDDLDAEGLYVSAHTADPGDTGASEVTGGSPAYARKALSWSPAASASKGAALATLDIPAGTTVTHFGIWAASSGGTFKGGAALPVSQIFGSQGTLALSITAAAT